MHVLFATEQFALRPVVKHYLQTLQSMYVERSFLFKWLPIKN